MRAFIYLLVICVLCAWNERRCALLQKAPLDLLLCVCARLFCTCCSLLRRVRHDATQFCACYGHLRTLQRGHAETGMPELWLIFVLRPLQQRATLKVGCMRCFFFSCCAWQEAVCALLLKSRTLAYVSTKFARGGPPPCRRSMYVATTADKDIAVV